MRWNRPEQTVILIAAVAVLTGSAALVLARRPAPAIRIFEQSTASDLVVQIDGAVTRPGLYHLPPGTRVSDALAAAGGPSAEADLSSLNRARLLRDGEHLVVPRRVAPGTATAGAGRLDLNTATAQDLEALPGIGPVLAGRIVAYRAAHGPFQRVEDLLQVEGIGPKLLDRLRARVVAQ